jgi:hypothetical protein
MYAAVMFKAMFLLAFHCFLRVGEFTTRHSGAPANEILQYSDISFISAHNGATDLQVTLRHFKGNTNRSPFTLLLRRESLPEFCPVRGMED